MCSPEHSTPLLRSIGRNIKSLIDREDEPYCFRLHQERVYYVRCVAGRWVRRNQRASLRSPPPFPLVRSERVLRQATSVSRDDLVAFGVCMGKFTKSKKFRLKVTALDVLSQHAKVRAGAPAPRPCPGLHRARGGCERG